MDDVTPAEHPGIDLLGDLAAQVLEPGLATRVEAHVIGCPDCASLLAEAEGVHTALLSLPPEPMPADIVQRIEYALAAERSAPQAASTSVTAPPPPVTRVTADPETGQLPSRRSLREGRDEDQPAAPALTPPRGTAQTTGSNRVIPLAGRSASAGPATGRIPAGSERLAPVSRLRRMTGSRQGARRQALEEQRSDRPSRLERLTPALRVAAGVIVVLGVGAGAFKVISGGSSADSQTAAGAASAGAPVLAPVLSTGTNYAKGSLSSQVRSLVSQSQKLTAADAQTSTKEAAPDAATVPRAAGASSAYALDPTPAPGTQANSSDVLRSTTALRACLTALGEPDAQPVAVDLARYGGRDAAIVVLPADGGGYNVWVVERTCGPAGDGTLDYVVVKP